PPHRPDGDPRMARGTGDRPPPRRPRHRHRALHPRRPPSRAHALHVGGTTHLPAVDGRVAGLGRGRGRPASGLEAQPAQPEGARGGLGLNPTFSERSPLALTTSIVQRTGGGPASHITSSGRRSRATDCGSPFHGTGSVSSTPVGDGPDVSSDSTPGPPRALP